MRGQRKEERDMRMSEMILYALDDVNKDVICHGIVGIVISALGLYHEFYFV